jgi:acyl carrier protein
MIEPTEIEGELLTFLRTEVFAADAEIGPDTNLVDAGFDSMSLVRLLLFIETKYGRWIPEGEITSEALQNVRSLAGMVAPLLHEK